MSLKPCPFCGCDHFTRSIDGGILPYYLSEKEQTRLYLSYKYTMSGDLWCDDCGARMSAYTVSNDNSDLFDETVKALYDKWNERR